MADAVDTYRAELLSMSAGRDPDGTMLMMTIRPDVRIWWPCNLTFTPAQAQRMHRELGKLLADPQSWLHVPEEQRLESEE